MSTGFDVVVMAIAAGADLGSTLFALKRGARELNPLMRLTVLAFAIKAVVAVATVGFAAHCRDFGHPSLAVFVVLAVAAAWLGVAVHNLLVIRRLR